MRHNVLNKKGMGFWLIAAAILALVVLVIFIVWEGWVLSDSGYYVRKMRCKESVKLQAVTAKKGVNIAEKLDCPTEYFTFSGKEDAIKRQMANQMYDCWDKMGRYELMLYDDNSDKFCIICSVVDFKEKDKKINDFPVYLATHNPPKTRETYFELFNGQPPKVLLDNVPIGTEENFDTSKSYAVVYTFLTEKYLNKIDTAKIGGGIGAGAGIGASILVVSYHIPLVNVVTLTGTAIAAGVMIGYGAAKQPDWNVFVGVVEHNSEYLNELECVNIPSPVVARG